MSSHDFAVSVSATGRPTVTLDASRLAARPSRFSIARAFPEPNSHWHQREYHFTSPFRPVVYGFRFLTQHMSMVRAKRACAGWREFRSSRPARRQVFNAKVSFHAVKTDPVGQVSSKRTSKRRKGAHCDCLGSRPSLERVPVTAPVSP